MCLMDIAHRIPDTNGIIGILGQKWLLNVNGNVSHHLNQVIQFWLDFWHSAKPK